MLLKYYNFEYANICTLDYSQKWYRQFKDIYQESK